MRHVGTILAVLVLTSVAVGQATRPAAVTVRGGAWIKNDDGSSSVLRGLRVSIISKRVPAKEIIAALIDENTALSKRLEDLNKILPTDPILERYRQAIELTHGAISEVKNDQDFVKARQILEDPIWKAGLALEESPDLTKLIEASREVDTKTDIDGKFLIQGNPSGPFYIHAKLSTPRMHLEWIIPVHATGDIHLDLDSDETYRNGAHELYAH